MANVDVTRIAGNIGALNALNSLQNINKQLAVHQTRLSTGKRINSAADDPAGLTIATKMLARSQGMSVVIDNIGDASNMLSVAESGLSKMNDIMVQMRNKAEQAASDTLGSSERSAIQTQLSSYAEQIDAIVGETKWNGSLLLDGSVTGKVFQTGVDENESTTWALTTNHTAGSLNIATDTTATGDAVTDAVKDASVSGITAAGAPITGMTEAATGSYALSTTGHAASSSIGALSASSQFSNGTLKAIAVAGSAPSGVLGGLAAELGNGSHSFSITGYTVSSGTASGNLQFTIDGTAHDVNVADAVSGADVDLGGGLAVHVDNTRTAVSTGTRTVDYIQTNTNKYALKRADGSAVSVSADGTTNASATSFYVKAGGSYNTGVGISVAAGTLDTGTTTKTSSFDYTQSSKYSVDVSTAAKAGAYMTTVNTAINTVNESMTSLGSLMARLDYKSEALTNARVNVEASYNRVMNANMAEEQMNASKFTILQQTAVAMLAQANQAPQSLLSLFR
jgi:flagellin